MRGVDVGAVSHESYLSYTTKSYSEAICDCKFVKNVVIRAVPGAEVAR